LCLSLTTISQVTPLTLSTQTIQAIRSTKPLPQITIKLLEQDEPHAVAKLLCCDLIEFYLLCEKFGK